MSKSLSFTNTVGHSFIAQLAFIGCWYVYRYLPRFLCLQTYCGLWHSSEAAARDASCQETSDIFRRCISVRLLVVLSKELITFSMFSLDAEISW